LPDDHGADKEQPTEPIIKISSRPNLDLPAQSDDTQAQLLQSKRNIDNLFSKQNVIPLPPDNIIYEWCDLSVDDINISLKVIGDLSPGCKLKIVNNTHLADDTSYVSSITRYSAGQGRDKIFGFLEHMHAELVRNVGILLGEIRSGVNIDNNVCVLKSVICKLAVFLHKYENMRSVYKTDSSMYARLGNNRDKFHVFLTNFFRDVVIPGK